MESIVDALSALAHPQRLAVFRLLIRRYPDDLAAGEIAEVLQVRLNTLSAYLATLRQAGLISQRRDGRSLLYRAEMGRTQALMSYLIDDCCRGRPELCPPAAIPSRAGEFSVGQRPFNVLFICTGNSARSIIAEAILRDVGQGRFTAFSAGTQPYSELNPMALQVLAANGHDAGRLRAKHVDAFRGPEAPVMDFVFTVCDRAANEECAAWPGQPITAHWGQPDPVRATGSEAEKLLAFRSVYAALNGRLRLFAALNPAALDRITLQRTVDRLATQKDVE